MDVNSLIRQQAIPDFSFGFDDANYSDKTLLLEIVHDADTAPTAAPRLKTIHINSLILAARSPFFRKLFSNGMRETEQKRVKLQIEVSEEVSFMDLLKYVYSNNLPTSLHALLDLLVTADKFEVASCMGDCTLSLQNLPMTCVAASLYWDLPSSLLKSPAVQPLTDAAKQFFIELSQEFDEYYKEELLNLPLAGFQAVLSSDELQVSSECVVLDLVLDWANKHYLNLEERREILNTHLLHLVRFPFMSPTKLAEIGLCCSDDIDLQHVSKLVIRALWFKAETSHVRRLIAEEGASQQFVERAYNHEYQDRPVKVVEFELPRQQCIVYLDLMREELMHMSPAPGGRISSRTFHLGRHELFLNAYCFPLGTQNSSSCFMLTLEVVESAMCRVKYEIAFRMKQSEEFENRAKGIHTFIEKGGTIKHLLNLPWTAFIDGHSPHFINGILHLRVDLTIC